MNLLYSQPYLNIERRIEACRQFQVESVEYIHLYEDKITTPSHSFSLEKVLDVSYKPFSAKFGLLYLHTNQGVFSFLTETFPNVFIELYQITKK